MKRQGVYIRLVSVLALGLFLGMGVLSCGGGGGGGGTPDTVAPSIPSNLQATAMSKSRIDLAWSASTDNVGVAGYEVFRGATSLGTVTATSYSDATGLTPSTEYTYTVKAYDDANNFSDPSSPATATTGAASIRVRVIDEITDAVIPGATVVLGDRTAALVSTGATDANGEVTFIDPPAEATITTAVSGPYAWDTNKTSYRLETNYNVNMPAITLAVEKPPTLKGCVTVNVTVAAGISGVVGWKCYPNGHLQVVSPVDVCVLSSDVQKDGKVSLFVVGVDANEAPVAYGALLDQPQSIIGTTVNVVIGQTDFETVTATFQNAPAAAWGLYSKFFASRNGSARRKLSEMMEQSIPLSKNNAVLPGYGDSFESTNAVFLDQDNNSSLDAAYGLIRQTKALADQNVTIDFSSSLYPLIPSNRMISGAGTARPAVSWTGSDAGVEEMEMEINYDNGSTADYQYDLVLPSTRTSIVFPELPAALSDFRPTWIGQPGIDSGINSLDFDLVSGYNNWLTTYDEIMSGSLPMPSAVNVKVSRGQGF